LTTGVKSDDEYTRPVRWFYLFACLDGTNAADTGSADKRPQSQSSKQARTPQGSGGQDTSRTVVYGPVATCLKISGDSVASISNESTGTVAERREASFRWTHFARPQPPAFVYSRSRPGSGRRDRPRLPGRFETLSSAPVPRVEAWALRFLACNRPTTKNVLPLTVGPRGLQHTGSNSVRLAMRTCADVLAQGTGAVF
jgi:hypothetical protein